jgi:hypothetical protein
VSDVECIQDEVKALNEIDEKIRGDPVISVEREAKNPRTWLFLRLPRLATKDSGKKGLLFFCFIHAFRTQE